MSSIFEVILRSLEYGSIYAFAAFGIILIYRTSYTTNFAQGVIGMFTTFAVAKLMAETGINIWVGVLFGIVVAILMGLLIDLLIMRHSKKVNAVGKQIITLGILMIIVGITPMVYGVYPFVLPRFFPDGYANLFGATISYNALFNIALTIVVMLAMLFVLLKTKVGLAIRATASNEPTARLMGIPTKTVTMASWAIAAALSLLAGVMAAPFGTVNIGFMNDVQIGAFMAVVLGGFSTFHGPVIAAFIISVSTNLLQVYLPTGIGTVWGKPIVYLLILVFLIFKPLGLFGKKTVKKV
ncbi:MAG: branched-chain amino acid ABC transporter permease [Erysipelothrix sp.]|nr:branched-chain amino acid ABC transporter permease [Erysipelothrix sp.]